MAFRRGQRRVASSRAAALRRAVPAHFVAKRLLNVLLIALGLLFAQVPTQLHLLLVSHTICEHGELVERTPRIAPLPGEGPGAFSADRRSEGPQIAVSDREGEGHAHCDALAVQHQIPEVGVSVAPASLLSIEPVAEYGERSETRPVPLLSLAPKGSPPAA